jgi:hypothetical protein
MVPRVEPGRRDFYHLTEPAQRQAGHHLPH